MTDNASRSRIRWLLVLLALTAALFLVVASACGGDDDEEVGDNGATATEDAGDDGGDDGGEETPDSGDDDDDDSSDAAADLLALASEYEEFEGYVKYAASDFGGTDALSSMAIYQMEGYSRVDIESSEGNVTLITTPDATYMCAEEQCLKYPNEEGTDDAASAFTQFIDPGTIEEQFGDLPEGVDYDVSEEEIAGVDATCFSANGDLDPDTTGDESGEVCFSDSGLLLRITFDSEGETGTLEAVEADSDVDESDFEPPFEVIDIGDIGDIGQ